MVKFFSIGNFARYYERFKSKNRDIPVSIPFVGGPTVIIPLAEKGNIPSTRKGLNEEDRSTPFVESNADILFSFYSKYKNSKEYKFARSPYAETIPLKKGKEGFSYGHDVDELKINVIDVTLKPAAGMEVHWEEAPEFFKKIGNVKWNETIEDWENNDCVRIANWDLNSNAVTIQPANYFQQISTNLTLDWASGFLGDPPSSTIRNNIEKHDDFSLQKLNVSTLANTLGVAVIIINRETKEVLIPIRGSEQAIMNSGEGEFHCSASGVFKWEKNISSSTHLTFEFFMEGMERVIDSEIGMTKDMYDLIPLAFSRELVRGGKPQLFFIAETDLDIRKIQSDMKGAEKSWSFIHEEDLAYDNPLRDYIECPLEAPQDKFTYEGWMALQLSLSYIYKIEPPFALC